MSDFLARLSERSAGDAKGVRPRRLSWFEPGVPRPSASLEPIEEILEDRQAPPTSPPREPLRRARPSAHPAEPLREERRPGEAGSRHQGDGQAGSPVAPAKAPPPNLAVQPLAREATGVAPTPSPAASLAPSSPPRGDETDPVRAPGLSQGASEAGAPHSISPQLARQARSNVPVPRAPMPGQRSQRRHEERRAEPDRHVSLADDGRESGNDDSAAPVSQPPRAAEAAPVLPAIQALQPRPRPFSSPGLGQTASRAAPRRAEDRTAPSVHVTIGRVEVRATIDASPVEPKRPADRDRRPLDLQDYLRDHARSRR
jgi:hypothetical protein